MKNQQKQDDLRENIEKTIAGLKDFQAKTVDYVYHQLYHNGRSKMLIADEVGLGKTIVAKGIIAKRYEAVLAKNPKQIFSVIYICSNQALAAQNLDKLNFTGEKRAIDFSKDDDRITALAYVSPKEDDPFPVRIKAFTPATSFDDKTHAGRADERVLLYRLLYSYSDFQPLKNSLKWMLKGNRRIKNETWEWLIHEAEAFDKGKNTHPVRQIRPKVFSEFRKALERTVKPDELPRSFEAARITYPVKYWTLLRNLCQIKITRDNFYQQPFAKEIISSLRFELSRVCVDFLQADLFILDEFQRYKQLIDKTGSNPNDDQDEVSPAIQIARDIFNIKDAKILMLSATPFKPYTNDFDALNGEVHYNEFLTVLQFLMADKSAEFWKQYEKDRKTLFGFLRHPDALETKMNEALELKNNLEALYRSSIVRTEKLLVSQDRDAMIKQVNRPVTIQPEDINDFVALDQITQLLNKDHKASLPVPLEYVKSCPFALSFLDRYQHKEKMKKLVQVDPKLRALLQQTKHGWVNLKDIDDYKPLIPQRAKSLPNAKLRLLLDETVHNNGWKYLWIPPTLPYYALDGAYKDAWGYSKTLIFSSWKLVPRMVASLVSYEAERLSVGNPKSVSEREKQEHRQYFSQPRSPYPQFTFKVQKKEQEPQQMNNFILTYPCLFLANLFDPAVNVVEKKSLGDIKKSLKQQLVEAFHRLDLNSMVTGEGDQQKWTWLAPLLLDKAGTERHTMELWFNNSLPASELAIDAENVQTDKEESDGKSKHFDYAKTVFLSREPIEAARLNEAQIDQICDHLVHLALGSPAVCYLRTQLRYENSGDKYPVLYAAHNVALAFLTLFNKPESIAIVRIQVEEGDYWKRALQYMIDGNIQAMLDEYVYLLYHGENKRDMAELRDLLSDVLTVRTSRSEIDDYTTFLHNVDVPDKPVQRHMRAHYAVDFGVQKINTSRGADRQINIRQAFNSPFRPFVLASTSIGQEGLDFHFYCRRIFHWNLPANPIDFEQREGRIHRFQSLVIRLNLAEKYRDAVAFADEQRNVWNAIFKCAENEKQQARFPCDLVPFWHTEPNAEIKIERFVPLYPFSRDQEKFSNLIKILTFYRLTFGQPRQDELVDALHEAGFSDKDIQRLDDLIINLSPIRFATNGTDLSQSGRLSPKAMTPD